MDTLVIGAGISGLTYAWARRQAQPDEELCVLESTERPGGLVRTVSEQGFRWEEGPEALQGNGRPLRELCAELDLPLEEASGEADRRYLESDGKLIEVPASPADMATSRLLPFGAKLRLMAEATSAKGTALDGSIADFARHRFGAEALERLVDPLVAGIHAGDPEQLSLRACFPQVVQMVEEHGSITGALRARAKPKRFGAPTKPTKPLGGGLVKPASGMQSLTDALARGLGERVLTGRRVRSIAATEAGFRVSSEDGVDTHTQRVVLALPLKAARALLADAAPAAAAALASMEAESLVSVIHAYPRREVQHALDGFGYLVPKRAGGIVLGTLFSSTIAPASAPEGHVLLRSLVGGARNPDAQDLSDEELMAKVQAECAPLLGLTGAPELVRIKRYPGVIPRFDLEHLARRETVVGALPQGLHVLGNFMQGIGIASLVEEARRLAREL
jgi:oxygen-dependent protoporphyrinogen oxidase